MKKHTVKIAALLLVFASEAHAQSYDLEKSYSEATGAYTSGVIAIASQSSCSQYNFKNRGEAPAGYIKGVALSFARSLCRYKAGHATRNLASITSEADQKNDAVDAITHYASVFTARKIATNVAGEDTLRATYALGLGLGMRESSGTYCEGWDTTAGSKRPSSAGEAGPFQTSYDSIDTDASLGQLYQEYTSNPARCMLDVFKEGATCQPQGLLGTGDGAVYQAFNKSCPAFATEYAMALLRLLRTHFGPINRLEAEVVPACNTMLVSVQAYIDQNQNLACKEIF
jgi:hypothetical protein